MVPSWQLRQSREAPVGLAGSWACSVEDIYLDSVCGNPRLQRGVAGVALWGAWQKMQICNSWLNLVGYRPLAERLWGVVMMLPFAMAEDGKRRAAATKPAARGRRYFQSSAATADKRLSILSPHRGSSFPSSG